LKAPLYTPEEKPARIRAMFAAIVPHYDLVNALMTLGLDRRWRRHTVALAEVRGGCVLDIATGTGDLAFEMTRQGARTVVGADFCPEMLVAAQRKAASENSAAISFAAGDAMRLPFRDEVFDAIVNGFMLRNVAELNATFCELHRVLKPGGRLVSLDLTPPRGAMRHFFALYIATVVPALGIAFARNYGAYRYLFQSLNGHPEPEGIAARMRAAGFEASYQVAGFGTVAIHLGRKR